MQETNFYKLRKPDEVDFIDVADLNFNADVLDRELNNLKNNSAARISTTDEAFINMLTGNTGKVGQDYLFGSKGDKNGAGLYQALQNCVSNGYTINIVNLSGENEGLLDNHFKEPAYYLATFLEAKKVAIRILTTPVEVIDNLTDGSTDKPISAAQGKWLNENKLGKTEKAADSDKLDGQDCTYFATATAVQTAQTTATQGVNAAATAQTTANQGVNAAAAAHSRANEAYTRAEQAFQSASNGKITIANAITGKGVPTSTTASWSEMARNIGKIKTFKFKRTNINSITLDFNYTHSAELQYTFEKDSILVYQRMKGAYYTSDRIEISIYPTVNPWYDFGLDEGRDNRTICVVPAGTYTIRGYSGSTRWSSVSIPFEIFE